MIILYISGVITQFLPLQDMSVFASGPRDANRSCCASSCTTSTAPVCVSRGTAQVSFRCGMMASYVPLHPSQDVLFMLYLMLITRVTRFCITGFEIINYKMSFKVAVPLLWLLRVALSSPAALRDKCVSGRSNHIVRV